MNKIVVRKAAQTDSFYQIASCIYQTDPFIYPSAFGLDRHQAAKAISELMKLPGGLFCYENILVALCDDQICGVLLCNRFGACWDQEQCNRAVKEYVPDLAQFIYVSQAYFSKEAVCPPEQHIEVIACCVDSQFRKKGVAHAMLAHLTREHREDTVTLDVLADNDAAINLYSECGFKIMKKYKGFSMDQSNLPDAYRMIRE